MKIAIIDYNAGNTQSVKGAIERIGYQAELTCDPEVIQSADRVIFPGVGEAKSTMLFLTKLSLNKLIPRLKQPVLGICLGMQLMCEFSEENQTKGLNIFNVEVKRFKGSTKGEKIPHVGWNNINNVKGRLFYGDIDNKHCYFVHSYFAPENKYTIASCDYIQPFSAAMQKDNFFATQFHPEKSGQVGEFILKNFIEQ